MRAQLRWLRPQAVLAFLALALVWAASAPVWANPGAEEGIVPVPVVAPDAVMVPAPAPIRTPPPDPAYLKELEAALHEAAPSLDPRVLALALRSYHHALRRGLLRDPNTLTVIDYSRESCDRRFWVFDLTERKLLFEELVAHGKNSGTNFATRFSNAEKSQQSSLGLFVTGDIYFGEHGESLRLAGLERGINDNAMRRAIVIHGAEYVDRDISSQGFLGRSWGCPALSRRIAPQVIERIQGGSALFAYYPDTKWIANSLFLDPWNVRIVNQKVGPALPEAPPGDPANSPRLGSIQLLSPTMAMRVVPDDLPPAPVTVFTLRTVSRT